MNNKCDKSIQNSKIKEDRVETIFFIPYIELPSIIFSQKLKELLKKYCIAIRIVFTSFKVKKKKITEMLYSPAFVGQCSL